VGVRRTDLGVFVLLLLAVCMVFWPVLGNGAVPFGGGDGVGGRIFTRFLAAEMAQRGEVPLWYPYIFGGMPTVDSLSFPLFYPLHALYVAVPRLASLFPHIALHLILAGAVAYLLARDIGLSRPAAALPALGYALTGYLVTLTASGHGGKIWTAAYLPLLFFVCRRLLRRPTVLHVLAAGLVAGVQMLAGHYQVVFYSWLAVGMQLLWYLSGAAPASCAGGCGVARGSGEGGPGNLRRLLMWLAVPILAVGIAAAQFIPAAKYAPWSNRAEPTFDYVASFSLPPGEIITFGAPHFYGFTAATGMREYWGSLVIRGSTEYMGIAILLLALVGVGVADRRLPKRIAFATAALFLLAMVAAFLPSPVGWRPVIGLDAAASSFLIATLGVAMAHWCERIAAARGAAATPAAGFRSMAPMRGAESRSEVAALLLVIGAWAGFLMVGDHLPTFRFFGSLPGFDRFRAPHSMVLLVAFSVVMLAGLGLDQIYRAASGRRAESRPASEAGTRKRRSRRTSRGGAGAVGGAKNDTASALPWPSLLRAPVAVLIFGAIALVLGLLLHDSIVATGAARLSGTGNPSEAALAAVDAYYGRAIGSLAIALSLWGAVAAWLAGSLRGLIAPRILVAGVLVFTLAELFFVDRPYVRPFDEDAAFAAIESQPLLQYLVERVAADSADGNPSRVANLAQDGIDPNDPAAVGLMLTGGYHGAPMGAVWDAQHADINGMVEAYISLMGARYLLYPSALARDGEYRTVAGMKTPQGTQPPFVVENLRALPRAWIVHRTRVVPDRQRQLEILASRESDPRVEALLDAPLTTPLAQIVEDRSVVGSEVEAAPVLSYEPNRVTVQVDTPAAGILLLSDAYYPGWVALLDGADPLPLVRADFLLRGVVIPAGKHRVVLEFRPRENRIGAAISLVVALGVLAGMLWRIQVRKRGELRLR
jgi:hypothetical protein